MEIGSWVGGMYTALCCRYLAQKGHPLTLVTPGNHKAEIFRVVEALGAHFDQVVLAGYPPFLKEVVDSRLRGRAEQLIGGSLNVAVIQEAGLDGFWVHPRIAPPC
jgi:phenylacetate-coenzyme A ligase PaaK-like adenylate-forming protein